MLEEEFEQAAEDLPFRMIGHAFLQTVRTAPDQYRLYLVDPGWVDPQEREVEVKLQLPETFRARDLLSGEEISIDTQTIAITVPAGLFRILEVNQQ